MSRDIADELREILDAQDGRTIWEMREDEPHYDIEVEKAEYDGKGTSITFDQNTVTYLTGREVKAGDTVTVWDGHDRPLLGSERHGWAHNGELVEWLTPYERIAKRVRGLAEYDRSRRERIERGAEKRANDYDSLPAPLKARIDRFASEKADFWMNGDYELFCCVEAARIADHLRPRVEAGESPEDVVRAFYELPWAEQQEVVSDQHSGNTFGGACSLARSLLEGKPV